MHARKRTAAKLAAPANWQRLAVANRVLCAAAYAADAAAYLRQANTDATATQSLALLALIARAASLAADTNALANAIAADNTAAKG